MDHLSLRFRCQDIKISGDSMIGSVNMFRYNPRTQNTSMISLNGIDVSRFCIGEEYEVTISTAPKST